eukprot:gene13635-13750_t
MNGLAQTNPLTNESILKHGAAKGTSNALEKYADFYIKRAEQLQPVIQVAAGRPVDIVFSQGLAFGDSAIRQTIGKINDQKRHQKIQTDVQQLPKCLSVKQAKALAANPLTLKTVAPVFAQNKLSSGTNLVDGNESVLSDQTTEQSLGGNSYYNEALKGLSQFYNLSAFLPYESYDETTQLFFNQDSLGFVIETLPLVGASEEMQREILILVIFVMLGKMLERGVIQSGSGKSVFMQEQMTATLGLGGKVFVMDVGRSFEKTCSLLEGQFIEFKPKTSLCLNPFSTISPHDEEAAQDALAMLKSVIMLMAAPTQGVDDLCTITHIADWLLGHSHKKAQDLGTMLSPYTRHGVYGRFFNGPATVNLDNPLVVVELEELKERQDLQAVVVQMMIINITNRMFLGDRKTPFHIVFDEAWDMLRSNQSGVFIETLARRLRKYYGSLIVGTQSINDFFVNPAAQAAFDNSDWMCLLSQKKESIEQLKKSGRISLTPLMEAQLSSVKTRHGSYAEIMIYSSNGYAVGRLILDPYSGLLYSTKAEEYAAVQALRAQGLSKIIIQTTTILLILFELTVLSIFLFLRPKHAFGTVDTSALIAKQSEILAKHYPKGKVSQQILQEGADQIKKKVAIFAKDNNLVIIAKGAIWGGTLPDYTEKGKNLMQRFYYLFVFTIAFIPMTQAELLKDYGVVGATFEIIEEDLLEVIGQNLRKLNEDGSLQKHQQKIALEVQEKIKRSKAVEGIQHTKEPRSFTYDPSITVPYDLKDHQGKVFHAKGTKVEWAIAQGTPALIILVKGVLTKKFGILQVPARITQQEKHLLIEEINLQKEGVYVHVSQASVKPSNARSAGANRMQGRGSVADKGHSGGLKRSFYQVHWYVYPVIYWLELLTDFACLERASFDVAYLTELDPLWNDEETGFILNPEAVLFGNPIAQGACAADCGDPYIRFLEPSQHIEYNIVVVPTFIETYHAGYKKISGNITLAYALSKEVHTSEVGKFLKEAAAERQKFVLDPDTDPLLRNGDEVLKDPHTVLDVKMESNYQRTEYPEIITVTKEEWSDDCASLEDLTDKGVCQYGNKVCIDGPSTKMIQDRPVTKDCWQMSSKSLKVQRIGRRRLRGSPFCITGNCVDSSYQANGEMLEVMAKLSIFKEMQNDIRSGNFEIFKGTDKRCSRNCIDFKDCCQNMKGWGTDDCPYCHQFSPIVKKFSETYGWEVIAISQNGEPLEEFPEAQPDNGLFAAWKRQEEVLSQETLSETLNQQQFKCLDLERGVAALIFGWVDFLILPQCLEDYGLKVIKRQQGKDAELKAIETVFLVQKGQIQERDLAQLFLTLVGSIIARKNEDDYEVLTLPGHADRDDVINGLLNGGDTLIYACDSEHCLNPTLRKVALPEAHAFLKKVHTVLESLPVYKILNVTTAYRKGYAPIDVHQYADLIALDILYKYILEVIDIVHDSVAQLKAVQVDDSHLERSIFKPLMRLGLGVGSLWALAYSIWGDYMKALSGVFIKNPAFVTSHQVDHVPFGLAMSASLISRIGHSITENIEMIFTTVDDLKYHKTGFLFASNLVQQAKTFHITNEDLASNMREFVGHCVVYDAMLGRKYTIEDLRNTDDIWTLVSTNASPVRSFVWKDPHNVVELDRTATLFGQKIFGKNALINPKVALLQHMQSSYTFLVNSSKSALEILKQQMMIYAVVDGIEQKSVALGNTPNFAVRRAYLQQRSTYETLGAMAGETLPTMKAVLEAIVYSSFMFIVPLSVLPFGWRFLSSWGQTLLWLQMWAPLYAILHYLILMTARSKSLAALSISSETGVTIASSVGLVNANADLAAMAGYLAISIPFLAVALVKGVGSFVHMASHLGSVSQGAASMAAGESVSGNYSFGNISEGNRQIANTNMLSHRASFNAAETLRGITEVSRQTGHSENLTDQTSHGKSIEQSSAASKASIGGKAFGIGGEMTASIDGKAYDQKTMNEAYKIATQSLRAEASKSFRESEDLQKQAAWIQSNASTINTNFTQQAIEGVANMPADNARGRIGMQGVAHMAAHNPELLQKY